MGSAANAPKRRHLWEMIAIVLFGVGMISLVDAVLMPPYAVKSAIKILLFLGIPLIYGTFFHKDLDLKSLFQYKGIKKGIRDAFLWGSGVFFLIIGAYLLIGRFFDFSQICENMEREMGIHKGNFIFVVLYISFVNSLLEEFFFRGFACLRLQKYTSKAFSYCFSSFLFALYHTAMMWIAFEPPLVILALAGLFVGGFIFNHFNQKYQNLYISWLIHMGANFAINSIGIYLMYYK